MEAFLSALEAFTWSKNEYQKYLNFLYSIKNETYKKFHSKIVPDISLFIGLQIPIMDKISKSISKTNFEKYYSAFLNYNTSTYEEKTITGFVIANLTPKKDNISLNFIQEKIDYQVSLIDNWALCDYFCARLKIIQKHSLFFENYVFSLCFDENCWKNRVGFVLLLDYYINKEYLNKIFKTLEKALNDDYYVMMAQSWLISVLFIKFPNETIMFLNKKSLLEKTHNTALQKIRDSKRVSNEHKLLTKTMVR
ncbi:MAG: DNA alkylation repair protein [Oscillospiraceae bacterium]